MVDVIDCQHLPTDVAAQAHHTVTLLDTVLALAVANRASDIHFEPYQNQYRIRARLDGMLQIIAAPPANMAAAMHSRIKMLSGMDIAEKRLPQDGRMTYQQGERDIRVSSCPGMHGEKMVLRLLSTHKQLLPLKDLGLSSKQLHWVEQALAIPQGMILVTGPTGSGKSISLYSMLTTLNQTHRNICTIEDPIEITLDGIHQVAVNTPAKLSFERALRAFLRQDPDVMMVGEIRDTETAEIALKASQTGHLVLSTLHTNSAADTLVRLLQMGVAAYHLSSAIKLIIAQRLARKLCPHCKAPDPDAQAALCAEWPTLQHKIRHCQPYQAIGCEHCNQGYRGRIGIFEVLCITPEIQQLLLTQPDKAALEKTSKLHTLRYQAVHKVLQGCTSLAEINRVTLL